MSWTPCNVGYMSHGGACSAIDPNNTQRAIMVGANTGKDKDNALHLTTDAGKTWTRVYKPGDAGFEGALSSYEQDEGYYSYDSRIQLAYDETSKDDKIGGSAVVYWSREDCPKGAENDNNPAIYKSTDGGKTWAKLAGTEEYAGGYIVVNPKDGRVAVSNSKGAWVSSDGGATFKKVSELHINSLVGVRSKPDNLYALTNDGLYVSTDFGGSFNKVTEQMPSGIKRVCKLRVSPANPDKMFMYYLGTAHEWDYRAYYSHDGGKTWTQVNHNTEGIWIPVNSWTGITCFSPVDENMLIGNERRSEDGGKNFIISTKGFNAILVGGHFSINVNNPELMAFGSQDFNGGYSYDGGKSWVYINWSGKGWGGFTYGAYAMTDKIVISADSSAWGSKGELVYTKDGGKTVVRTGNEVSGPRSGYGVVGKENIAFLAEWRTDDYCDTWTKMNGCDAVFTHDPKSGRLYGSNGYAIVYSDDDGVTWTQLCITEGKVDGMAFNHESGILYACINNAVRYIDTVNPKKIAMDAGFKVAGAMDICIDSENPNIMYVIQNGVVDMTKYGVKRTLDGGKTWTQLRRQVGDGRDNCPDGGYGSCVVFNPATREIITSGACRGIWKMKAAPADATNK